MPFLKGRIKLIDTRRAERDPHSELRATPLLIEGAFGSPIDERIVHKGLEEREESLFGRTEYAQHRLARGGERAVSAAEPQSRLHRRSHPERDGLGHLEAHPLFEAHVVVDVEEFAGREVEEHVVEVPITQPNGIPEHRHGAARAGEGLGLRPPGIRVSALQPQLLCRGRSGGCRR